MELTQEAVRHIMLAAQGLSSPPKPNLQKSDLLSRIRAMGYLQIDTIQVVARSPYLVLWSRLGDYNPAWLEQLHSEGSLFEYYAHALCWIPLEDYPILREVVA